MRKFKAAALAAFLLFCAAVQVAHAQGAMPWYGAATVGHVAVVNGSGGLVTGLRDAGTVGGGCALNYNCGISDLPLIPQSPGDLNGVFQPLGIYDNQVSTGNYHSWLTGYVNGVPTMTLGASGSASLNAQLNIVFPTGQSLTLTPQTGSGGSGGCVAGTPGDIVILGPDGTSCIDGGAPLLTTPFQITSGSNTAPSYSFSADATSGLYLSGTGVPTLAAGGLSIATFSTPGASHCYLAFSANNTPTIASAANAGCTNPDMAVASLNSGSVYLEPNSLVALQATAAAAAVNYAVVHGAATGSAPSISAAGSDSAVNLQLSAQSTGTVLLGTLCQVSGATPQTCNGQRGLAGFTGLTTAASTAAAAQVIDDNVVTSTSVVECTINGYGGTIHTNGVPVITQCVPGSGTITVQIQNVDTLNALSGTITVGFVVH